MKIGILGSHCTGKTTLAQQLSEKLKTPLIPEQARHAYERGFALDKEATLHTTTMIWMLQLQAEQLHTDFIADRTLMDPVVYYMCRSAESNLDVQLALQMRLTTLHMMDRYDILFYTPILWPVVGDGVRNVEEDWRQGIDMGFRICTDELKVIELPAENRLDIALEYIDGIQRSR